LGQPQQAKFSLSQTCDTDGSHPIASAAPRLHGECVQVVVNPWQQWPSAHVLPLHDTLHPPQLKGSDSMSMQWPPQSAWPTGQLHSPLTQLLPSWHATLQAPQFTLSVWRSTQTFLHST
jgi:hypothetical protein